MSVFLLYCQAMNRRSLLFEGGIPRSDGGVVSKHEVCFAFVAHGNSVFN